MGRIAHRLRTVCIVWTVFTIMIGIGIASSGRRFVIDDGMTATEPPLVGETYRGTVIPLVIPIYIPAPTDGREGDTETEWLTADERQITAIHEAGHAVVAWYDPNCQDVISVHVLDEPDGLKRGWTGFRPRKTATIGTETFISDLASQMGGIVAEEYLLGTRVSFQDAARTDMTEIRKDAEALVMRHGISRLGFAGLTHDRKELSDAKRERIENEIERILDMAERRAWQTIYAHTDTFIELVRAGYEEGHLYEEQIAAILGPRPENR